VAERSEKQSLASAKNGKKSRGPLSLEGRAKSAENARKHGLTGKIEDPSDNEREQIDALRARLEAWFEPKNAHQASLIERILVSTIRLERTRALITSMVEELAEPTSLAHAHSPLQQYMLETEQALCEMTGEKKIGVSLLRLLAEQAGFERVTKHLPSTKLDQLARYAQRFRGERDSALKKLNGIRGQTAGENHGE
jgi:hypothetical protein